MQFPDTREISNKFSGEGYNEFIEENKMTIIDSRKEPERVKESFRQYKFDSLSLKSPNIFHNDS